MNETILVVDDNPTNLGILFDALETANFRVRVATNGEAALAGAKHDPPDLILLDIMMPGVDGFETCRRLKTEEKTKDIPVIFLTVLEDTMDEVKGFEAGAVDYITKPIQVQTVLARIENHLMIGRLQRRLYKQNVALRAENQRRQQAEVALQQANEALEDRVKMRTIDLERAYVVLKKEYLDRSHLQERLAAVYRLGREVTLLYDEATIVTHVLKTAEQALHFAHIGYGRVDEINNDLVYCYQYTDETLTPIELRLSLDEEQSIGVAVIRSQQAINVPDTDLDNRYVAASSAHSLRSALCVPLKIGPKVLGVLNVERWEPHAFTLSDQELLQTLANQAAVAIENARLYEKLQGQMQLFQETQAQLVQSEKIAALGQLSTSVAHEINNPLQAIRNALLLFKDEKSPGHDRAELEYSLNVLEAEVERIAAIIQRMHDFHRASADPAGLADISLRTLEEFYRSSQQELQYVALSSILEEALQLMSHQFQKHKIMVNPLWPADLPRIQVNPDHLKQIVLNLVINAIEAMATKGGTLYLSANPDHIQLSQGQPLPVVRLEISDTGPGVPPEIQPKIFDPFFSTKAQGSGLGLFVSEKIVEAHQGQMWLESQVDLGTTFTVLLPVHQSTVFRQDVEQ